MKKLLITFATWQYYKSQQVLKESALKHKVDEVIAFNEASFTGDYYASLMHHFRNSKRGFGYWVWKSTLIDHVLKNCDNDDVIFYIDSGNEVISDDISKVYDRCKADEKGIILFDNRDGEPNGQVWKNNQFTKSDCFHLTKLTDRKHIFGDQVDASYICFRKTDFSVRFFSEFKHHCENYNIISDEQNIVYPIIDHGFRDHRHDQSVLSLMAIEHDITILREPSQFGNHLIGIKDNYNQIFDHHRGYKYRIC